MSRLIVDSPKALGLAMMAGTSERGFRTAGPSPKALGRTATRRPRSARISTVVFDSVLFAGLSVGKFRV